MPSRPGAIWKTHGRLAISRTACITSRFTARTDSIANSSDRPRIRRSQFDLTTIDVSPSTAALSGNITINVANSDAKQHCVIEIRDNAYRAADLHRAIEPAAEATFAIDTKPGLGWYDLSVRIKGNEPFRRRYAGRVETGEWSYSDPAMGRVVGQIPPTKQVNISG